MSRILADTVSVGFPGGLLLALLLIAAVVGGHLAHFLRIPRVVGYLAMGFGFKYLLAWNIQGNDPFSEALHKTGQAADSFSTVKQLALGLILFSIGSVFETSRLRAVRRTLPRLALIEAVTVFLLVGVGAGLVSAVILTGEISQFVALGVLLAATAIATAPGATLLVTQEYDAKGITTDTILTLTGVNNIISIVLFHTGFLLLVSFGVIESSTGGGQGLWLDLLLTTVGSAALGMILGYLFAWVYAQLPISETLLIFFALFFTLAAAADWLHAQQYVSFNLLLTCLAFGIVYANIAIDPERLMTAIKPIANPVYAVFFALAGFELHLETLMLVPILCLSYAIFRSVGKILAGWISARQAGGTGEIHPQIGWATLCQAGVAIGLADFLGERWGTMEGGLFVPSTFAKSFEMVILGAVALFELSGPILTKSVVVRAGEVKAIALLRRDRLTVAGGRPVARILFESMLRTFGLKRQLQPADTLGLQVRHVMRTNVRFLPAAAPLDEVLHFVERSRFNHFPVVDDHSQLVGVVHFSDIREIIYDPALRNLVTALDLAAIDPPSVSVDDSLEHLLATFRETNYGSLPVVEQAGSRRVVGVVEQRDLFRAIDEHGTR